jgi:hypothetical protein
MPPQEMTGMASSVRPNLRYFIRQNYGTEKIAAQRHKVQDLAGGQSILDRFYPWTAFDQPTVLK